MSADNESRFVVAFDGTKGTLSKTINDIKSEFRAAVAEIQQTASKIELFKGLKDQNKDIVDAVARTRKELENVRSAVEAIQKAGGTVTKELSAQMREAEKAAASAFKEYQKQRDVLQDLRKSLASAGVDVNNLAAAELRLATSLRDVNRAAQDQSNKSILNVQTLADIRPQIAALNAAFREFASSGRASLGDVHLAAARLQQQVTALQNQTGGLTVSWREFRNAILGVILVMGTVGAAAAKAHSDFRDFTKAIAAVETIAETSKAKMALLAQGVRDLARAMGVDATKSAEALYSIIGSGIPVDNSLAVLALSTKAAIAGLTDVQTAAKVGVSILNAYGLQVNQLERVFDILFRTVRDGIVTFPELAQHIGDVLPSARSAKVPLEEVGAALIVLTRSGIPAAEAVTALNRVIQDLAAPAPEAQKALRELGIEFNGLSGTIEQVAKKSLTLGQLRDLVPDQRAVKGIQILSQNFRLLRDEIGEVSKTEATLQAAYATMAATPQAQVDRFNSAMKDLSIAVGQFVHGTGALIESLTRMINGFNTLTPAAKSSILEITSAVAAFGLLYFAITRLAVPINLLGASLFAAVPALGGVAAGATAASLALNGLRLALGAVLGFEFGKELAKNSENVRLFGDLIGVAAGRVDNLATFLVARLSAAFSGNAEAAEKARQIYRANLQVLEEMSRSIATGVTERLRQLQTQFESLQKRLTETGIAAVKAATDLQSGIGAIAVNVKTQLDAVETQIINLTTHLNNLIAKLAENVTASQTATSALVTNLNAQAQAQVDALSKLSQNEIDTQRKTNQIFKDLADERLTILNKGSADLLKAFEAEAKARIDVATRTAGNVKNVEQDILVTKRGFLQKIVDDYRAHIKQLTDQDQAHLLKIQELENQKRNIKNDIADKIREIDRQNLTIDQQYADKRLQVEENLDKAKSALLQGNLVLAEQYANKAIGLTDALSKEVKDGERVVVDALTAGRIATDLYQESEKILLAAVSKRQSTEAQGHRDMASALAEAKTKLEEYSRQLQVVTEQAARGLKVRIEANVEDVNKSLADISEKIRQQTFLVFINANAQEAKLEIDRLRGELEKGITVNVGARTDKIVEALKAIEKDSKPLNIDVKANVAEALANVDKVRSAAAAIATVQMEIKTNIEEVKRAIDSLKVPTESTHTIRVKMVQEGETPALPRQTGGPVYRMPPIQSPVQQFAGGGGVFARPAWNKVPGSGSGDIVRAALQSGSFVVRKAASRYYGDLNMDRLAHGFAGGGLLDAIRFEEAKDKLKRELEAKKKISDDIIAGGGTAGLIELRKRQAEEDSTKTFEVLGNTEDVSPTPNVNDAITYGRYIASYLRPLGILGSMRKRIDDYIDQLGHNPNNNFLIQALIRTARNAASNNILENYYGHSFGPSIGYTNLPDWYEFAAQLEQDRAYQAKRKGRTTGFAEGGAPPNHTIHAMLEPEEWVIQRPAVKKYGSAFMHMVNQMAIPRDVLADIVSPPRVKYFSTGGPVDRAIPALPAVGGRGNTYQININAAAGDLLSPENVRRFIVPVINDMEKRSR